MRPEHDKSWGMGWLSRGDLLPWMDANCPLCKLYDASSTALSQAGNCCYSWSIYAYTDGRLACKTEEKYIGKYERWRKAGLLRVPAYPAGKSLYRVIRFSRKGDDI